MQKFILAIIISLVSSINISIIAQNSQPADSTSIKTVPIDEVIVTGSKGEVDSRLLPMSVSVVNRQQIEGRYDQSLLPILTEQVPGLFITSRGIMGYGVSTGSAGGMSIRGVGGSPTSGVLILIDGHPQYMGLMGHPLPDSYQSMMAQQVEVIRGPGSVLYGSNAMGGVINIITKKQQTDGVKTGIRTMYGSYNTFSGEVHNAVRKGKFNSFISLDYNRTDGHRENMDFKQYSGYIKLGYDFTPNWKAFTDLNINRFAASNPGTETAPIIDNDANITRGMTSFSLENNYDKTFGAFKFFYNFGHHKINDGYSAGGTPQTYKFKSNDDMLGFSTYQTYRFFEGNQVTGGIDFQWFGGHAWNDMVSGNNVDIIDKSINDIAGYVSIQQAVTNKVTANAGLRIDHNSHSGTEWVPQIGLSYLPTQKTTLKAIASKGFRNPTIREMYMFPPQNPDLKPEKLMNYEVSASQMLFNNVMNIDLSLYYINGDNMIQTIRTDGRPLNINTGKIINHGLELNTHYRVDKYLSFSANYSWLHMKNKVLAAPQQKVYASVAYNKEKWSIETGVQYIHGLYTAIGDNMTKESYTLWNLRATYKPAKGWEIFAKGENLLAQKYEINKGFPMPKTTVFGGINVRF